MKITEWVKFVRDCKAQASSYGRDDLKLVKVTIDGMKILQGKIWEISITNSGKNNKLFNLLGDKKLRIMFRRSVSSFTEFQTEMLFYLFLAKLKPINYGNYHKCVAGIKFIENIYSIEILSLMEGVGEKSDSMKCKYCGCTDGHACMGGCSWVDKNVCSSCDLNKSKIKEMLSTYLRDPETAEVEIFIKSKDGTKTGARWKK